MNWGPTDWTGLTSVIAAIAALVAAWKGVKASNKVDQLEVKVDGRLTQLLAQTQYAARAEGVVAGRGETSVPPAVPAPALDVPPSPAPTSPLNQPDGTVVIGIPVPTPPMLLVPVDAEKNKEKEDGL